jgi:hypothetical protein
VDQLKIRHMQKIDLSVAVEIERQTHLLLFDVPGIGQCETVERFAWREADFLNAIRQYQNRAEGTHDRRAYVAIRTMMLPDPINGGDRQVELVVGSLVFEVQDDGFNVLRMSAVTGDNITREAFVDHLVGLCAKSRKRRYVRCVISDGDWECLRHFVRLGWDRRLLPSYFSDGRDGWLVETRVVNSAPPPQRNAAGA